MTLRKLFFTAASAALLAGGGLVATTNSAAAYIVCNHEGDCWHSERRVHAPPGVTFEYHPDDWYFHRNWEGEHDRHWRDYHEGRGYYRGGVWIQL